MKLMIVIVGNNDADALVHELTHAQFNLTKLSSTGGFLRRGNTTLLVGVRDDQLDEAKRIIKETCNVRQESIPPSDFSHLRDEPAYPFSQAPFQVTVGGATVFLLNLEGMIKF